MQQGCLIVHYFLETLTTNWVQIFTGLLFNAYVGIHHVRKLVFDNYWTCPVPLTKNYPCLSQSCSSRATSTHCVILTFAAYPHRPWIDVHLNATVPPPGLLRLWDFSCFCYIRVYTPPPLNLSNHCTHTKMAVMSLWSLHSNGDIWG